MNISRRRFISKTVQVATLLNGISWLNLAKAADTTKAGANTNGGKPANGSATLSDSKLPPITGDVLTAGAPGYDEARKNYNGRYNIQPKYILYCQSEDDVVQAVRWAQAQKIKVSIRSGGHSYEAFSLVQDGAVIDVSKMTNVQVDLARKIATVDAGTQLIPLYESLWQKGVIVPGGSCATVGVAGLALGGGFGLLARHMGLTCDNLQALRMVDAQGKVLIADAKNHSDLFWACRGGGAGNFGIATQFTFKVHPIGNVTIIKLRWKWDDMKAVIKAWQQWAPNVDDRLTSVLTLSSKGADSLLFLGMFLGSTKEASSLMQHLVSAVKPVKESIATSSFIDAARRFSGFKRPTTPPLNSKSLPETIHMHVHPRFKNTSDYVNADLSDDAIDTIIKYLTDSPIRSSCVQFDGYGGAINRVPVQDTAFCHRAGTKFCMHYQASWGLASEDSKGMEWVESFRKAMQPYVSGFAYANYCDLSIENWGHRYFGENLARLNSIKSKYDPKGFFSYAQSIRASSK